MSELDLYNLMLDYVTSMEQAGYTGSYVESALKSVKSWLSHNGKDVKRKIRIKGARDTPSLRDERVPTKEELRRVFLSGDNKTRVSCVLVAHSGVRMEVLGNYVGEDGLTIADLPELKIENDTVKFEKKPAIVVVRRELSKAGNQYFTFLSEEGCEYVQDYLDERLREGEKLTSKSPLITPKLKMKPFIRANNIGDNIRKALRAAGLKWRPYVLRSYFDTQLMLAESKGLVLRDYRQFWMGHKGDIENRYTTNKERLSENVIEDMREAYRKSQEYLETTKTENNARDEEKRKRQVLDTAKMLGYSDDKIKKIEDSLAKYKYVDEAFDEIRKLSEEPNQRPPSDSNERSQRSTSNLRRNEIRIVKGENDLIQFLNEKWELIREISDDRFVLTRLND
jgi:site-specific recombinase XerD